jgi:hypothetical protein
MNTIRTQINNIKPGDIIYHSKCFIYCFIVLNNVLIDLFGFAYRLTVLNALGHVIVVICDNDQYYDLPVV